MDSETFPARGSRRDLALLGLLAVAAVVARLIPVLRGGGLTGQITYDDGVYFGSAIALVSGRVPYRDFLLLHPPGILYILAPFAALGGVVGDGTAFAVARIAFMVLGAINTALVAIVAGRLGRRAGLFAGALYAGWTYAVLVEQTTWLIAPQNTLLLLALLQLARHEWKADSQPPSLRRFGVVGGLLGGAVAIQIWGVVPLAVVLAWIVWTSRSSAGGWARPALAYLAGAAMVVGVLWLPFLVLAGGPMLRYVFVDQLGRGGSTSSLMSHLGSVEKLLRGISVRQAAVGVAVVAFLPFAVWAAVRRPALRLWAGIAVAQVAVLAFVPLFVHYIGWLAPAMTLSIGATVDTAMRAVERRGHRPTAVAAAYLVVVAIVFGSTVSHATGLALDVPRLTTAIRSATCVTTDSTTLLIETGALRRDLAADCQLKLDPTGTSYDTVRVTHQSRLADSEYQETMEDYYDGSDAALFTRLTIADSFEDETWSDIRQALPTTRRIGPVTVLTRIGT